MDNETLAMLAAGIAAVSALFSFIANTQSRYITRYQVNLQYIAESEKEFCKNFDLVKLHNIDTDELEKDGITPEEFCYILQALRACEAYYVINDTTDPLSQYRITFLNEYKVHLVYTKYLKGNFFTHKHFRNLVDSFYSSSRKRLRNVPTSVTTFSTPVSI